MAENQRHAVRFDLDVGLDALPTFEFSRCRKIVVAGDEMLVTIKASKEIRNYGWALANGKVAEMPDHIVRHDRLIPPLHHGFVHCRHRRERPPVKPHSAAMAKMRVAGEVD